MFRHQRQIILFLILCVFVAFICFGVYQLYPIIKGPEIEVLSPKQGEVIEETSLKIRGNTKRVSKLFINGSKIEMNKSGSFETDLAIYAGSNILLIEGYDSFGKKVSITKNIGTKN